MDGRSIGRCLGHGTRRLPELQRRSCVARGNGCCKLPRRCSPPFALGERRGVEGIGRALVSFYAAESRDVVFPNAIDAVRLDAWLTMRWRHLQRRPTAM